MLYPIIAARGLDIEREIRRPASVRRYAEEFASNLNQRKPGGLSIPPSEAKETAMIRCGDTAIHRASPTS